MNVDFRPLILRSFEVSFRTCPVLTMPSQSEYRTAIARFDTKQENRPQTLTWITVFLKFRVQTELP